MKKAARVSTTVVTALALILGGSLSASAGVEYVGGGTFHYGADASINWCNYHHPSKKHRCTVENRFGTLRSPDTAGGYWAYKSQPVAMTGNRVYWYVY